MRPTTPAPPPSRRAAESTRMWWLASWLSMSWLGCAGTRETEWPEEQSCGGTGEEHLEGVAPTGCTWPRGGCELTALLQLDAGGVSIAAEGRLGTVLLGSADTDLLGDAWDDWLASAPGETLALARDLDGGLRALGDCRLEVGMTAVAAASSDVAPAWVALELLPAAPSPLASSPCDGATHFVAVAHGDEGVAFPLACPPLSSEAAPRSCVAVGLDGDDREAWGRSLYGAAQAAYLQGDYARALDGFLTLRALMPDSLPAHHNLGQTLARRPETSCGYRDALTRAARVLPEASGVLQLASEAQCVPAPPLLGCLTGFVSPPSLDHC